MTSSACRFTPRLANAAFRVDLTVVSLNPKLNDTSRGGSPDPTSAATHASDGFRFSPSPLLITLNNSTSISGPVRRVLRRPNHQRYELHELRETDLTNLNHGKAGSNGRPSLDPLPAAPVQPIYEDTGDDPGKTQLQGEGADSGHNFQHYNDAQRRGDPVAQQGA